MVASWSLGTCAEQETCWVARPACSRWGALFHLMLQTSVLCTVYSAPVLHIFVFLLVILPKPSSDVLSSIPKCRKAGTCFMEKIGMLDKLHLGVSYSAPGCEFNASGQQYTLNKVSLNRNTLQTRLCIDQLMKMWLEACKNLTLYLSQDNGSASTNSVLSATS